jgi:hypothetical protein
MKSIYKYLPAKNNSCRVNIVACILYLQFGTYNLTSHVTFTLVISEVCVQCMHMAVFCSSFISYFLPKFLWHFLNDFQIVQIIPSITAATFFYTALALYF